MKIYPTLLVTLAGAMIGATLFSAKAELEKQKDNSAAAPVTNEGKNTSSARKTAPDKETGQAKTQPEDVKLSAGISEIVKMVRSDTDTSVIQAYIENSPIAYYPSVEEIIYLHQLGAPPAIVSVLIRHGGELRARAAKAYKENQNANAQPSSPTIVAPAAQAPSTVPTYYNYPDYGYNYPAYSYGAYPYYSYSYWPSFYFAYSYPRCYGFPRFRSGYCAPRFHGFAHNVGFHAGGHFRGGSPGFGHFGGRGAHRGR